MFSLHCDGSDDSKALLILSLLSCDLSLDVREPVPLSIEAMTMDLPPGAAHMSSTSLPGAGESSVAVSMEARSMK